MGTPLWLESQGPPEFEDIKWLGFPDGHVVFAKEMGLDHGHLWRTEGKAYAASRFPGEEIDPFADTNCVRGRSCFMGAGKGMINTEMNLAPTNAEAASASLSSMVRHGYAKPSDNIKSLRNFQTLTVQQVIDSTAGGGEEKSDDQPAQPPESHDAASMRTFKASLASKGAPILKNLAANRGTNPAGWFYRYGESHA